MDRPTRAGQSRPNPSRSGLRTMVVTRALPSPLGGGADLRRLAIVRALGALGPVSVFGLGPGGDTVTPPMGVVTWETSSDPEAGLPPEGPALAAALARGESPFAMRPSAVAAAELERSLRSFAPDLVVVSGLELHRYAELVRSITPCLAIDLDYAQGFATGQLARADQNARRSMLWRHASTRVADAEAAVVALVDQVWLGHAGEIDHLAPVAVEGTDFVVVPNVVDPTAYPHARREDPTALVYPARFDFWPNEDAARELVDDVAPRLPEVQLCFVGQAPPAWLTARAGGRITVTGPVPDVRPYLAAAAAMPIPLRAGAGTRLKALEAFATGIPVVSTGKGIEGLGLEPNEHYLPAETADEFVAALEVARHDTPEARRCLAAARDLVDRDYSQRALDRAVASALGAPECA